MLNDRVIASQGNAVGEIARGFAIMVDEADVAAVTAAMKSVLREQCTPPVLDRETVMSKYSWNLAARRAVSIFREVATGRATGGACA